MTTWTSPRTWNVGEKLTAALLNTHLRDNILYLWEVIGGTNTVKILPAALNLTSTAGLPVYNTTAVTSTAGNYQDALTLRGVDGTNTNQLVFQLQRHVVGSDYLSTKWRMWHVIDGAYNLAAPFFEMGPGGTSGVGRFAFGDNTGNLLLLHRTTGAVHALDSSFTSWLRVKVSGALTYAGNNGLVVGYNQAGNGEVDFYNDKTSPTETARFLYWNGSAWVSALTIDGGGKLLGQGFYASTSAGTSITTGNTATFAHGLGVRPRFYGGEYGVSSLTMNTPIDFNGNGGTQCYVASVDDINITVSNGTASTQVVVIYAMK